MISRKQFRRLPPEIQKRIVAMLLSELAEIDLAENPPKHLGANVRWMSYLLRSIQRLPL